MSGLETLSERRIFHRYPSPLPIRFTSEMLDFDGVAELVQAEMRNISRGGLFIRSDFLEVPGTSVRIMLTLGSPFHDSHEVHLEGYVAWVVEHPPEGPGMGIQLKGEPMRREVFDNLVAVAQSSEENGVRARRGSKGECQSSI